jgi:hypothetical protein
VRVALARFALLAAAAMIGCGGATPTEPPSHLTSTLAIAQAVRLVRIGKLGDAERSLRAARGDAAEDPRRYEEVDYYLATVLALRGDLAGAHRLVEGHAQAAANRADPDSTVWMQSLLAWVSWAEGDGEASLATVEQAQKSLAALDREAQAAWSQRIGWERAFFLIDRAWSMRDGERAERAGAAEAARDDVTDLAPDRRATLIAYAAFRAGDLAGAETAAHDIAITNDTDPAVAWVVTQALGQSKAANAAAARRRVLTDVSLVAALFRPRP